MAINNYICADCDKFTVCNWRTTLKKFSEDEKNYIPVEITIQECPEYKESK